MSETVRVYVGADRSQLLAVKVLEHSIQRHSSLPVEVHPMVDLPIRVPKDPKNWKRTGFSFSRFCIPSLAGYQGKALYLDADMLVFRDIASLWSIPFDGAKVIIQEELPEAHQKTQKKFGAPTKRIKQCSVMLLDCERLDWRVEDIIDSFDREEYDYEKLMYHLCILEEADIKYAVPFEWNSLEFYESNKTGLIHYTDMATQPWVSCRNAYGYLWLNELRLMLQNNLSTWAEVEQEIELGYFRPSLLADLKYGKWLPKPTKPLFNSWMQGVDLKERFKPHREVYDLKRQRLKALKERETIKQ
ncbi:MAG: glycosyl transferase [Leptolyngbya sp. SIO3F4]|nr:glycosyl transferase [Leptolyngbya sp. SIO3F4]